MDTCLLSSIQVGTFIVEVIYVPENNTQDIPVFFYLCFSQFVRCMCM